MKTLNPNKRSVLFALLVLSLGFSKSWLQTADNNVDGSRDLAQQAPRSGTAPGQRQGTAPAQPGNLTAAQEALNNARKKAHLAKKDEKPSDKDKKPDEKLKETPTPKEEAAKPKDAPATSEKDAKTTLISAGDLNKPRIFSIGDGDDRVEIVAKIETRKGRVVKVVNGKLEQVDEKERSVAVFTTDCEACKIEDYEGFPEIEGLKVNIDDLLKHYLEGKKVALLKARKAERKRIADEEKAEKARLAKEKQKAEELAEALKNCTKMADGYDDNGDEKYIEISEEKNPAKYNKCRIEQIKALPVEERREAFNNEYLKDLREKLTKSESSADRFSIISGLTSTRRLLGDSQLKRDLDRFKRGAETFDKILEYADLSARSTNRAEKAQYMYAIDSLAYDYSLRTLGTRAHGSDTAKFGDSEWLKTIRETGKLAIQSPAEIERRFFKEEGGSIFDGIHGRDGILGRSSGLRSDRVQTDWLDIPGGSTRLGNRNGVNRLPLDHYSSMDPRRSTMSRRSSSIDPRFNRRDSLVFDNQIDYSTTRGGLRTRSRY